MKANIYVSHATLFIFDAEERAQENRWTEQHWKQGFARRPTVMNLRAIVDEDGMVVDLVSDFAALSTCQSIVSFSLYSSSGRVLLSGGEPGGEIVWAGRPGWIRVTLGQALLCDTEPPEMRIVLVAEESTGDDRTVVRPPTNPHHGEYLESSEPL